MQLCNPACLYRHYNADKTLLYIGISTTFFTRLRDHKSVSHWFNEIVTVTIQHFTTLQEALKAETCAIKHERPLYNKKDLVPPKKRTCAKKPKSGVRVFLYLDSKLSDWVASEAEKFGINITAFTRTLLIDAYNKAHIPNQP